jgi:dipeptidyl aminopeptidase/acylaminoacyl peptidase
MGAKGHTGSRNILLGERPAPAQIDALSAERQVTAQTPPTFLAHARTDSVVPVANSTLFHAALQSQGVPTEYFELPAGDHGLGCGQGEHWRAWQARCLTWLRQRGLARD